MSNHKVRCKSATRTSGGLVLSQFDRRIRTMSDHSIKSEPHWQMRQFGASVKPTKYAGTWKWDAGFIGGLRFMPMFHVIESSHGYRKGCFKKGRTTSYTGPVIKTKAAAKRQAIAAMERAVEKRKAVA